ncbi:2,3-diaminopropionate biosynthesis protein SbnB [Phytohabitans rumicis]|uniref:2,3-diaminopropionate biosynthesis protein SbnB n=1 Tax=Phytohabitans rumicis TaxID=1076125 RepID=A0A6V8L922_9ACTN|nr:2,3-diaminopropionate biosynthesis protein SbnB [Phytohabitans rumicis]GFJ93742.1 2,3-diaminopropionate biosynthesis protein SbnB [Phytohabitans rumicis]
MLILGAEHVRQLLAGADEEVLAAVRDAYVKHERGQTALPDSVFLRFPPDLRNRIIAKPAYLGGDNPVAGVKWISSFPGNIAAGQPRASGLIVLNSVRTGVPETLLDAAAISARRTGASAALAAATIRSPTPDTGITLVGCGVINGEVLRFVRHALPTVDTVTLFDTDPTRAKAFAADCTQRYDGLKFDVADDIGTALGAHRLVSLATTATTPHLDGEQFRPGTLVLHVSLRDIAATTVLSSTNVVDDVEHVCQASTSVHLAAQQAGHTDFVAATLGGLLLAAEPHRRDERGLTLFSPFGLGILDLAVAELVRRRAVALGVGTAIHDFT